MMNMELFKKNNEELTTMCTDLVEQMESYMSNDLDYQTIQGLKEVSLDAVFEIADKIIEMDCNFGLTESDEMQELKMYANIAEALLGTLEQLKETFSKL